MAELQEKLVKANWAKVGAAVRPLARAAAAGDLGGDAAFSGWRRKKEIVLDTKATLHRNGRGVTIGRSRESAGPWTVAERGRHQGGASGFHGPGIIRSGANAGTTARTKKRDANGNLVVRKVRATKGRRWNGSTAGKGTWTTAVVRMEPKAEAEMKRLFVTDVVAAFERPL